MTAATPRENYPAGERPAPFVLRCLAHGFTADAERWRPQAGPPFRVAVNWLRWVDGTLWLAIPSSENDTDGVLTAQGIRQLPAVLRLEHFIRPADFSLPPQLCPTVPPVVTVHVPRELFPPKLIQRSLFA